MSYIVTATTGHLGRLIVEALLVLVSGSELGQRFQQHSAVITAAQAAGVSRIVYTSAPGPRPPTCCWRPSTRPPRSS